MHFSLSSRQIFGATAALLLALAAGPAAVAEANSPGSVGAELHRIEEQVANAVQAASTSGNAAAMDTGRDVMLAIGAVQNVYEDDLGKATGDSKLPAPLRLSLQQLDGALLELKAGTRASLEQAATHAEQVSNSMPYKAGEPKLKKMTPRFLVPSKEPYVIRLRLTGAFGELAVKPEFYPTLVLGDRTYKPVVSAADSIEFGVPLADIFSLGMDRKQLAVVPGTLLLHWQTPKKIVGKYLKNKEEDHYRLLLPALPTSPGRIHFIGKQTVVQTGAQDRHASVQNRQCSGPKCGPDDPNHLWSEKASPGCHLVPGTASFDVLSSSGTYTKDFLGEGDDSVTYGVTTMRKGTGGEVSFTISFMQSCSKEVASDNGTDIALGWGETKTVRSPAGSWKVVLDTFDGRHVEWTGPDSPPDLLLKVTATPDAVTLTVPAAQTLVYPAPAI